MKKYDLSILIPARNEEFLARSVRDILKNKRGKTEIIINLDGYWPGDPNTDHSGDPLPDHPDIVIVYNPVSIGQRAGTNQAAKLSRAKYVMKADAHLIYDEGFDEKLLKVIEPDMTLIPRMYNLHVFDWICDKCGNRWYQSPTPSRCRKEYDDPKKEPNPDCDSTSFHREIVFKPRWHKRTDFMRFDNTLHFQYWGDFENRPEAKPDLAPTLSLVGACWMVSRERYWKYNFSDERHGSWGQQGTEVACKSWLTGGRLMVYKGTWFAHLFRTQGGDFGFPYPNPPEQQENARRFSRDLWFNNKFEGQIYPLSWLIEKFWPIKGWDEKDLLEVINKGNEFYKSRGIEINPSKGIIYYTDNQLNLRISHAVKKQILKSALPITSVSLKPIDFGSRNITLPLKRGWYAYFKQILTALENSKEDIIFFCEHDWLYPLSHFDFTPPDKRTFYYDWNWWRVRSTDGHAVHYDTQMVPGLVAYREVLIEYYRKVMLLIDDYIAKNGEKDLGVFAQTIGFEPGTHNRVPELRGYSVERFDSPDPMIDIRHDSNLTSSKWSPDQFRSPKNARNWIENDNEIPYWGKVFNRFDDFIRSI